MCSDTKQDIYGPQWAARIAKELQEASMDYKELH